MSSAGPTTLSAPISWAQRKDSIYVTVDLPDVKDAKIELAGTTLKFSGVSNGKSFAGDFEFYAELDPSDEMSKYAVQPRNVQFHIMKKDKTAEFWPRLLKDKAKEKNQVKVDWARYVDEDEEKEGFDTSGLGGMNFGGMGGDMGGMGGLGGMDLSSLMAGMGGMGGMGGMPGMGDMGDMDDEDSDDEGLPDLDASGAPQQE